MNKRNINLIVWATWIAFLAASIQIIDQLVGTSLVIGKTGAWFAFMAWALYFLGGGTVLGGVKAFLSIILGIVGGIIIVELAGLFQSLGFWSVPLSLFIVVIPVLCLERIKLLDYIPALFVGCGAFFAIINYFPANNAEWAVTYFNVLSFEALWGGLGLLFGWISLQGKACINKLIPVDNQ